ncbi:MAG: WD40 repeat domain-containing protein [Gemmataceae bacterium]
MNLSVTTERESLPAVVSRRFGRPQWRADGELLAMAFAPDGALWSIEEPGVLKQWDTAGKLLGRYELAEVETLWVLGPSARYAASASDELVVYDVASRNCVAAIPQPSWVTAVAFHPQHTLVATGHDDGSIRIWDLPTKTEKLVLTGHKQPISAMRYTSDGELLAAAAEDRTITVWTSDGTLVRSLSGHTDRIPAVAWKPGTRTLVSAGWDTSARLWDIDNGEPMMLLNSHADQVVTLAFSPDGSLLACADSAANIHIWSDVAQGKEIQVIPGDRDEVRCLTFSRDGSLLAVGGADRVIHIWDPRRGELVAGQGASAGHAIDLLSQGSSQLLVSNANGTDLQVWDTATGQVRPPAGAMPRPLAIAASPDGQWIAFTTANPDSRLHIWDAKAKQLRGPFEGPRAPMTHLAFSPNSKRFASCCRTDGTAWLWNPLDGEPLLIIPEAAEGCTVEAVAWHPNNVWLAAGGIDWLATSGSDGAVTIWNVDDRVKVATFVGGATALAFDPSGQTLAIASPETTVCIFDIASQRPIHEFEGLQADASAVAFSPDGQYLAAGCEDHTVRLWNPRTGQSISVVDLDSPVRALRFSPDGTTLFTGNGNTTCDALPVERLLDD